MTRLWPCGPNMYHVLFINYDEASDRRQIVTNNRVGVILRRSVLLVTRLDATRLDPSILEQPPTCIFWTVS